MKLEKHTDKTLIGRTERGFDFLGYHFDPTGLSVAGKTIERFKERIARLYEQGADSVRIGQYVLRWTTWEIAGAMGNIKCCPIGTGLPTRYDLVHHCVFVKLFCLMTYRCIQNFLGSSSS